MDRNLPNGETRADVLMREALVTMLPLVRLLIANGVAYPQFAQALKAVFMDAAKRELVGEGKKLTDSAISLLSGVHRKDVRAAASVNAVAESPRALSIAAELCTRWVHDQAYRDADGRPAELPRSGPAPSFETLAHAVSKDFHPRTMLEELLRLGVAELDATESRVRLRTHAFVPTKGFADIAYYFGANSSDHLSAGAANLRAVAEGDKPVFLENAVFADELTEASIQELAAIARTLWKRAFDEMVTAATDRCAQDKTTGGDHRMRFGVYFYSEREPDKADKSEGKS